MTANQNKDGAGATTAGTSGTPKKSKGRPRKPKTESGDSAE